MEKVVAILIANCTILLRRENSVDYPSLIARIAQFSSLIPVVIGIAKYNSLPKAGKLFFYFMLFSACTEAIADILAALYNNNMPFFYVYSYIEFAVFCYILLPRLDLFTNHYKVIFIGLMVLMPGLLLTDIYVHSLNKLNTISKVTECVLIVFMGLAYLLQYIQSDSTKRITRDYVFWIAAGATLYFAVACIFFTMYNTLAAINIRFSLLTNVAHQIASMLSYLLYAVSFGVIQKKGQMQL